MPALGRVSGDNANSTPLAHGTVTGRAQAMAMSASSTGAVNDAAAGVCAEVIPGILRGWVLVVYWLRSARIFSANRFTLDTPQRQRQHASATACGAFDSREWYFVFLALFTEIGRAS